MGQANVSPLCHSMTEGKFVANIQVLLVFYVCTSVFHTTCIHLYLEIRKGKGKDFGSFFLLTGLFLLPLGDLYRANVLGDQKETGTTCQHLKWLWETFTSIFAMDFDPPQSRDFQALSSATMMSVNNNN